MDLSEGQLKILNIIAEKTDRSLSKSAFDTAVTDDSGLPAQVVHGLFLYRIIIVINGLVPSILVVQPGYGNALAGVAFQGNMDLIVG